MISGMIDNDECQVNLRLFGASTMWMEVVLEDNNELLPFYNSKEHGLYYLDQGLPIKVSDAQCEYLGKDETYWYFHKYNLSGVVLRYER